MILTADGPRFIDINPVSWNPPMPTYPGSTWSVQRWTPPAQVTPLPREDARPGVQTRQLLLAILGAAQHGGRRRDVAGQLWAALSRRDGYRSSAEELTPCAATRLPPHLSRRPWPRVDKGLFEVNRDQVAVLLPDVISGWRRGGGRLRPRVQAVRARRRWFAGLRKE